MVLTSLMLIVSAKEANNPLVRESITLFSLLNAGVESILIASLISPIYFFVWFSKSC